MSSGLLHERWYTPQQLAEIIGQSVNTLAHWRSEGKGGPAFLKISRHRVAYAESDVEKWLQALRRGGEKADSRIDPSVQPSSEEGRWMLENARRNAHRFRGHQTKADRRAALEAGLAGENKPKR